MGKNFWKSLDSGIPGFQLAACLSDLVGDLGFGDGLVQIDHYVCNE